MAQVSKVMGDTANDDRRLHLPGVWPGTAIKEDLYGVGRHWGRPAMDEGTVGGDLYVICKARPRRLRHRNIG
jgi:hypothetical protein